jgi:hypothetical protein
MKIKMRTFIMGTTLASLFTGLVVYWIRKNHTAVPMGNGFMDMLASSQPTKTRRELATIIRSPEYEKMGEDDLIILAHEMLVNYIKPGMSTEDTIHVKSDIATLLIRLQTIRTIGAVATIGGNGEGTGAGGDNNKGAKRNTNGFVQHLRGVSGQPISPSHI